MEAMLSGSSSIFIQKACTAQYVKTSGAVSPVPPLALLLLVQSARASRRAQARPSTGSGQVLPEMHDNRERVSPVPPLAVSQSVGLPSRSMGLENVIVS